eukprot:snap_masked-scaffold_17-processed-gene-3.27-mRNA-1 protein AED:1.00 eAED:1.00 QI:0/0/0/0/1/1/4/0/119
MLKNIQNTENKVVTSYISPSVKSHSSSETQYKIHEFFSRIQFSRNIICAWSGFGFVTYILFITFPASQVTFQYLIHFHIGCIFPAFSSILPNFALFGMGNSLRVINKQKFQFSFPFPKK